MKKKKLASAFLSLSLAAGVLAGCSGSGSSEKSSGDGDTIKIGVNLELSGGVASYGQSIAEGLELATAEINKEGIDGKKIKLIKVDNKSEASEATSGAIKLTSQDQVAAIVGAATSTNSIAQVQIAQDNKVPVISPSGTSPEITFSKDKLNDYVFRTSFIDPFQGTVAANFAAKEIKAKSAAIYIDSSSDYSKGLAAAFKEQFEKNGGKVVAEEAYIAKDTDFRSTLTRLKSAKPDFIFLPGYYEEAGLIVKQARETGLDVPFMGGDGWDSPKLVEIAGAKALNNTFITNHYSSGDPDEKIQNFVSAFKAKYKDKSPDAFNALGYDTGYFLADAIKRAGSADSEKIKEALEKTADLELVTGTFTLDEKHNPIKSATILEFKEGKQVFNTKINP
ncbi:MULTISPECIES: ABC transporter substrate-binding protein [Bacillaceae]|uniref:ABC transporter substrate-binding protein n=1 Tax=Peribacillus castrilensis TaxID=2897690 RepID=A0AAW9NH81_9BACI|nr:MULTISPECIES: ABC transporter substrate-binding protein [Bacillaceae]MBT2603600.1 ABC transporter substrate-binding protein [Bacillus sp. ISL-53]MCD1161104.1 ABC transporter substrate-binding protein [Peribacillus castrilensis]MDP9739931.1 branched-chain amino acid transport system substrate-binding protein [Bacillus sp. B2I3]QYF84791.1 ABC transporter substrate-binding protein [Brevibacterium sp. PAMC21349]TDL88217.1 ABC transporter substrate-binding protein [Vibrio vulnificus]